MREALVRQAPPQGVATLGAPVTDQKLRHSQPCVLQRPTPSAHARLGVVPVLGPGQVDHLLAASFQQVADGEPGTQVLID